MSEWRDLPDQEAAQLLHGELQKLDGILKTSFVRLGLIVREFHERMLWRHVQSLHTSQCFQSFGAWISETAPYSRRHCYAALGIVSELAKDIPQEDLLGINETNARLLQACSSSVRKELVTSAKSLSSDEFVAHVEQAFPGQHLEARRTLTLVPTGSARLVIEEAIALAMRLEGLKSRTEALECICEDYAQAHREEIA
jgi:hypothetical protein